MTRNSFLRAGHLPTLVASFLYFDLSFMVWVLLGPLAVFIAKDLALTPGQNGLMLATPILAGAFFRIVAGFSADVFKPRRTALVMQAIVIAGLLLTWALGVSGYAGVLGIAILLGVAGASFAVALPLASYWYPPEHQGTALGIAGAGNSGTVLAALFAPSLALAFGWQNVIGMAAIPLIGVLIAFSLLAKDSPNSPPRRAAADYLDVLKAKDAWWLMGFYCVTFGGFVGLSYFLPTYFVGQYGLGKVNAGYCTAACVFCGSFARPLGGMLADRVGGIVTLSAVYGVLAALLALIAYGLGDITIALPIIMLTMATFGAGNGSVFQIVPQRFQKNVGIVTGFVGAMGGVGGFLLNISFGYGKQYFGTFSLGFALFATLSLIALAALTAVSFRWRQTWMARTGAQTAAA